MPATTLQKLAELGQSIWLDNISRSLIESGKLIRLIEYGLRGMTSNPTIFEKAISKTTEYDAKILELAQKGKSVYEIYDDLTIRDIQEAADIFMPVFRSSGGLDGYVSLEINPNLARDAARSVQESRRLSRKINRPNVMFKIPATIAGFAATEELLSEGINVNVTLIFSLEQYSEAAQAYLRGLKALAKKSDDLSKVSSVASVFVSRLDTMADNMLDELMLREKENAFAQRFSALKGEAALANSARIYFRFREIFSSESFEELRAKKARPQRVLWASTGTKNPAYSDIKYVSELVARDTVNTLPDETLMAFLDHGEAKEVMSRELRKSENIAENLRLLGVDINNICRKLFDDGLFAFEKSFEALLKAIEDKAGKNV